MDDNVLKIINEARNSLGPFCIEKCKSLCCKKGSLILFNNFEIIMIAGEKIEEYTKKRILSMTPSGNFLYDLERAPCRHLGKDFYCKIWKEENRPRVCQDFPLFVKDNYVITGDLCPAIKEGILDVYLEKLKKLGLKIL